MNELKRDIDFIKSHTLQPKWFKILKVFIILGFLIGHYFLYGLKTTTLFFALFIFLSLLVHFTYRAKTKKWTQTWLDFVVIEKDGEMTTERIGIYYYSAIVINTILSLIFSQVLG